MLGTTDVSEIDRKVRKSLLSWQHFNLCSVAQAICANKGEDGEDSYARRKSTVNL